MAAPAAGSTSNQACAACKYQRRKCSPECPLSPYFPPDQPKRFHNVHKLFGVSNILRILKLVDPAKREDTIKSIVYEADTREKDPVHGCLGVVSLLQSQMVKLKEELAMAREQLYMVEQQQHSALLHQHLAQQQAAFAAAAGQGMQHPALGMTGSGQLLGFCGQQQQAGASGNQQFGVACAGGGFAPQLQDCQQHASCVSASSFLPDSRPCSSPTLVNSFVNSFVDSRSPFFQSRSPLLSSFVESRPVYSYAEPSAGVGPVLRCRMQPALYSSTKNRHHAVPSDRDMKNAGVYLSLTNN